MPEEKPKKFTGWKLNVPGAPAGNSKSEILNPEEAETVQKEQVESLPEPKIEPKPEAQTESVSESRPEPEPEVKAEPVPEPKPEPEPQIQKPEPPKEPKVRRPLHETAWLIADHFINWEIVGLAFLLPLFFLPITTEFFEFNKLSLLAVATILGYLAWGIKSATKKEFTFRPTYFDFPVLAIWLVTAISTILSDSPIVSILGQYGRFYPSLVTVTIYTLFYFLVSSNLKSAMLKWVGRALILSAVFAVAAFVPQYFGFNWLKQSWSTARNFTPTGSPSALVLLVVIGSLLTAREAFTGSWPKWSKFALGLLALLLLAVPVVMYIPYDLAQKGGFPQEIKLDLNTSWSIAATSFRQKPIWGSGPGTFASDFTLYKPLSFNQSPYWSIRFDKPLSEYLVVFAELGLLGVLAYLFLIAKFVNWAKAKPLELPTVLAGTVLVFFLFSHATAVSAFFLFIALGSADLQAAPWILPKPKAGWVALIVAILLALAFTIFFSRLYAAEMDHHSSLSTNDAVHAYSLQQTAIQRFPWYDAYHLTFSRTNFALASSLASKKNPTDDEKSQIQVLVSQAINEARAATDLSPMSAADWENLAQLYRTLIGLAQNAQKWAVDSYQHAVSLDLFNPVLRLDFGGLYYQVGQYDLAIDQFQAAVNLKSDWANAHYNLAVAYNQAGKIDLAIQELETTLKLATPQTQGYADAQKLLAELQAKQSAKK